MHVGVDSFVSTVTDPTTGHVVGPAERMEHLLEEIELADRSGLYSFGIGEHHRSEYYDSAPPVILAAAAARTAGAVRHRAEVDLPLRDHRLSCSRPWFNICLVTYKSFDRSSEASP